MATMTVRLTSTKCSFLLCCCLLLVSIASSSSSSGAFLPPSSSSSQKVSVGLYYESLCPYSAKFIVNHLVKLFDDDLISIVDLHLSPWGNTKLRPDNLTFVCQHGPYECLLDTVEACAIEAWPKLSDHFPFIYCVESLVSEHKYDKWETCYEKLELNSKPMDDCLSSGHGIELELQYAAETNALQPPHKYVPWVVVDGQPLYEDYENFIGYICNAYKGNAAPGACAGNSGNALHRVSLKRISPVCRKGTRVSDVFDRVKSGFKSWMNSILVNIAGLAFT
ncbi:PREDICTED: gamma-interferon-inducible lysosomal thiol reductase-like [Tarenaya hassleriana]|uniref:gamma-interferon-inducible lysosomal thiol reductase-like n=1 Tax=Tarenaya hassleriana TaxID=28532 RepID=UPI00053CA46A|nr:PREDICTED: gamma-interferon-inducible lysosomal thiol reductase-like [Tarenaya hassleriana]